MEQLINWLLFFQMLPFMLFGFCMYILTKFAVAVKQPDYSFKTFVKRNELNWILSFLYCVVGCYFFIRGIGEYGTHLPDIVAFILGITGGSLGKATIKILTLYKPK